jgi:tRNA (cytidine/uridine-2'-O-)-methyltransferase
VPDTPSLHIALVNPQIGPNTGNIGRLCLGIGARLHLVHPLGFSLDEKQVRRAGLDYWKHVDLQEHADLAAFLQWLEGRRFFLYSTKGEGTYARLAHERGDVLVFGQESKGLPADLIAAHGAWRIPMPGPVRSLNLSNSVSVVSMHALRGVQPELF